MNRTSSAATRLRVLALALLFLGSQAWSALHHARERHVRCAEHGEWVHAGESGAPHAADARPATRREGPSLAASEHGATSHEHCELASPHRERALPRLATFDLARPAGPTSPAREAREAPRAPSIPLHRLAPKQSPPC